MSKAHIVTAFGAVALALTILSGCHHGHPTPVDPGHPTATATTPEATTPPTTTPTSAVPTTRPTTAPTRTTDPGAPEVAKVPPTTAGGPERQCVDGTWSHATGQGACSHHGGVR